MKKVAKTFTSEETFDFARQFLGVDCPYGFDFEDHELLYAIWCYETRYPEMFAHRIHGVEDLVTLWGFCTQERYPEECQLYMEDKDSYPADGKLYLSPKEAGWLNCMVKYRGLSNASGRYSINERLAA